MNVRGGSGRLAQQQQTFSKDIEDEERQLQLEFDWILEKEVHEVLDQVRQVLRRCAQRFRGGELVKPEKFVLKSVLGGDNLKCVATLLGEVIYEADISMSLKVGSRSHHFKTRINPQSPWRLNQIQDSGNHLANALAILDHRWCNVQEKPNADSFSTGEEVVLLLNDLIAAIHTGQSAFMKPKRRTLEELQTNPNLLSLDPALPQDTIVSFYVQSCNLILTAYQLQSSGASSSSSSAGGASGALKSDVINVRFQSESPIAWFHEVLTLFSIALQLCQQLKDKITVLQQCLAESG